LSNGLKKIKKNLPFFSESTGNPPRQPARQPGRAFSKFPTTKKFLVVENFETRGDDGSGDQLVILGNSGKQKSPLLIKGEGIG
jgi:hypothetical protein